MAYKILPTLIYECDACQEGNVIFLRDDRRGFIYECPLCSAQVLLPEILLPAPLNQVYDLKETINYKKALVFNKELNGSLFFSLTLPTTDRFTRNYIFQLLKAGLHAARVELSDSNKQKQPELGNAIDTIEDILFDMKQIGDINYDSANMPEIAMVEKKYSKFIIPKKSKNGKR